MGPVSIRGESRGKIESSSAAGDDAEYSTGGDPTENLRDEVTGHLRGWKLAGRAEPYRHRRIEMTAGDVSDGIGHRQHGQTERERYAKQTDTDLGECSRENRAAATTENKPEGPEELSGILSHSLSALL